MEAPSRAVLLAVVIYAATCPSSPVVVTPPGNSIVPTTPDSAFLVALDSATLVFSGAVIQRGQVTTKAFPAGPLTTVVRVDSVFKWPPSIANFRGRRVTIVVAVADTADLRPADRYLFLSYGLIADSSLVLQETRHYALPDTVSEAVLPGFLARAATMLADSATKAHATAADLAVFGRVVSISDSAASFSRGEHAPRWRATRIAVREVVKGDTTLREKTVQVLYPGSRHYVYSELPRPVVGDTAIFVVHRLALMPPSTRQRLDTTGVYAIMDNQDVITDMDLARFRRVVR